MIFMKCFVSGQLKNNFPIRCDPCSGAFAYVTNSITHVQPCTPNYIVDSTCILHLSNYFTILLLFVVEHF